MSSSCNLDKIKALRGLDTIRILKKCPHCRQALKKPVVLPCGHTVCNLHVCKPGKSGFNFKKIICKLCGERHEGHYTKIKNKIAIGLVSRVNSFSMNSLNEFVRLFDVN